LEIEENSIPDGSESGGTTVRTVERSRSVPVNGLLDGDALGISHHRVRRDHPPLVFVFPTVIHRHTNHHFILFLHLLLLPQP